MATLPPSGAGRTASLGTGTSRSRSVAVGRAGRGTTIATPILDVIGSAFGTSDATAVSEFEIVGNTILQENGDQLLQENGDFLLVEDAASFGTVSDINLSVRGVGAALADAMGMASGVATVTGVIEAPGGAGGDSLLQENGDDLLQENSDFILLEVGVLPPSGRLVDVTGLNALLSVTGDYLTGV
jgi:hypothetical protein